ncbi:MAG: FHA domain-containing protein, partial [Ktedonobacteraceae bacterium]
MEATLNGPFGQTTLGSGAVTFGRAPDNQLSLNDAQASSHHAEIRPEGQGYAIIDKGSTNGTFVNEQRINSNVPRLLNAGDRIRIGGTVFTYETSGGSFAEKTILAGSPDFGAMPPQNYPQ